MRAKCEISSEFYRKVYIFVTSCSKQKCNKIAKQFFIFLLKFHGVYNIIIRKLNMNPLAKTYTFM